MKISKNLPIYLLSASLLFVGVASISQAQGATSTSSQILALQKQVKTLNSQVKTLNSESQNTHAFVNIIGQKFTDDIATLGDRTATLITTVESRIATLENNQKPTSIKTAAITYAVMGTGSIIYCDPNHFAQGINSFNAPYNSLKATPYTFGLCSTTVLIP